MTTIGVLGRQWRATVTPWGAIEQWDGLPRLDWFVAADDRWHTPADEPTVRQTRIEGTPVVETRLRIPSGDAVQRVYAVADHGGLTVIEVTNESPLPIAVAFAGAPVRSPRPPAQVPIEGIDLPSGTPIFPVGHHATLVVAVAHDPSSETQPLPAGLPPALQVGRGWLQTAERASRLVLPETAVADRVVTARCELLLAGPSMPEDDPAGFLLGVHELVRCGGNAEPWVPEIADAVHRIAREAGTWDVEAALDAAEHLLVLADERRAVRDLRSIRAGRPPVGAVLPPAGDLGLDHARLIAATERRLASGPHLFPAGIPAAWWGQGLEAHRLPTGPTSTVSFAVRWHGERPALLWETAGEIVTLDAPVAAPGWSSAERTGETLWPAPVPVAVDPITSPVQAPTFGRPASRPADDEAPPVSFS
jgi:hypothetical protein